MPRYGQKSLFILMFLGVLSVDSTIKRAKTHSLETLSNATPTGIKFIDTVEGSLILALPDTFQRQNTLTDKSVIYLDPTNNTVLIIISLPIVVDVHPQIEVKLRIDRLLAQFKIEDPNLQILSQGVIQAGELTMRHLAFISSFAEKSVYSYISLGQVGRSIIHIQFSTPSSHRKLLQPLISQILTSTYARKISKN